MHWKRRWAYTQCLFQCMIVAFCHVQGQLDVRRTVLCPQANSAQLVNTDDTFSINASSFELAIDRTYEILSVKVKKELRRGHSLLLLVSSDHSQWVA